MPDQDTVQVQMPDGRILTGPRKNLPIAIQMGGKIYDPSSQKPPQVGAISRAASGAWDSVKEMVPHDLASLKSAVENPPSSGGAIVNMAQSMAQKMLEAKQSGGGAGEIVATGAGTAIGLPVDTIRSKAASGDVAGTVGSAIPPVILAMLGLTEKGRTVVRDTVSATSKPIMREFMGVADKDVQPAIKESQAKATAAQVKYHEDMADATKKYLDDLKKVDEDNKLGTDKHTAAMSKARQDHETEVAKIEKSNADAQKAHTDKIEEIKSKTAAKIADQKAKQIESSRAQTASQTKQSALATKKGPVYQRITDMADEAQANVREVDKKVRALENARWNAFEKEIDHPVVDWEPVQKAVVDAEDNILQGSPENVAIFRSIMKEGDGPGGLSDASVFRGSGGVDVKEFLSSIKDPVKRQQFIRDMQARGEDVGGGGPMPKEGATVPFKTARGFATEFNEKIYGRDLPSDVRRALRFVQDENDKQLVKAIAGAGGKNAVMEYRGLRSRWRDYMQTFYDRDSPIRKLKQGADPSDKLNPIVGDEGERAIRLFGKYRDLGADVQGLGKIRALNKSIRELPSSTARTTPSGVAKPGLPEAPSPKEMPSSAAIPQAPTMKDEPEFNPPDAPTIRALTLEEARRQKLEGAAKSYSHPPSRWELMFPPLHGYRLILKNLLQSKGFRDWLSKGDGGGVVPSN